MFPFEQKKDKLRGTPESVRDTLYGRYFQILQSVEEVDNVVRIMKADQGLRSARAEQIARQDNFLGNTVDLEEQKTHLYNLKTVVAMAGGNERAEAVVATKMTDMMYEEIRQEELVKSSGQPEAVVSEEKLKLDQELNDNTEDADAGLDEAQVNMLQSAKDKLKQIYGEAA